MIGAHCETPLHKARKASATDLMVAVRKPKVMAMAATQNATMGMRQLLKLLGKSCPVTLSSARELLSVGSGAGPKQCLYHSTSLQGTKRHGTEDDPHERW